MRNSMLFTFFALLMTVTGITQNCNSWNGDVFTPRGNIHTLVIFVTFDDDFEDLPGWLHDEIPDWAAGPDNRIFNALEANIGQTDNLSNWYHEMSNGMFRLTGDMFPES